MNPAFLQLSERSPCLPPTVAVAIPPVARAVGGVGSMGGVGGVAGMQAMSGVAGVGRTSQEVIDIPLIL